jgi:hypothetical protein
VALYAAAATAGVGALGFAFFGVERANAVAALDSCKPNCSTAQSDHANGALLVLTDASLLVAVGGLGTAAYLLLFDRHGAAHPTPDEPPKAAVAVTPWASGVRATVTATF